MITKEDIKAWIKKSNIKRPQLAERVGVSKGTMNNWLSGADPIPKLKLELIERIMQEGMASPAPPTPTIERAIAIPLTAEDYETVKRAANGKDLDLFVHDVVMEITNRILSGEVGITAAPEAERPTYGEEKEPFA